MFQSKAQAFLIFVELILTKRKDNRYEEVSDTSV